MLFLHPSAGGYGADRQLFVLATGLDPSRYRPLVVLPEAGVLSDRLGQAGVEVHLAELPVLKRGLLCGRGAAPLIVRHARAARALGDLARSRRTGIVHSNTTTVLCGQAVARRAGARHVQHVREIYAGTGGRVGAVLWPALRRRIASADTLLCVSRATADQFGTAPDVSVVFDALSRRMVLPDRDAARRHFGIDAGSFVIAVIGRISDWKGQTVLLNALAAPALAGIDAVALVAGDAAPDQRHFEHELKELRRDLRLDDRVQLLGFRGDVERVLAAADVAALPSTHPDSLPNVAMEAAAARVPLVATSTGGLRELVEDGLNGRLVPPGDPGALAEALRAVADEPTTAERLAEAAAAGVRERFDPARLLEQVQSEYDALCGVPRHSRHDGRRPYAAAPLPSLATPRDPT